MQIKAGDNGTGSGNSPLIYCSQIGSVLVVNYLLSKGANPNIFNYNNNSSLLTSVSAGHKDIVISLIKGGADPYLCNTVGHSAYSILENLVNLGLILLSLLFCIIIIK